MTHRKPLPDTANSPTVQALLTALPETIPLPGGKTVRQVLVDEMPKFKLSRDGDGPITGLGGAEWNQILRCLKAHGRSYQTRYRYRKILREIAEAWQAAGLITELPDLDLPMQRHRKLALRVDLQGDYRFSEYCDLVSYFVDALSGKDHEPTLVPQWLPANLETVTMLSLLLSGMCVSDFGSRLGQLRWADVVEVGELSLLRLPDRRRRGWRWLVLQPLAELLVLTAAYRASPTRQPNASIFSGEKLVRQKQLRQFLETWAEAAGQPRPTLANLIELVRLDLRQTLTNTELALLTGVIQGPSLPLHQIQTALQPPAAPEASDMPSAIMAVRPGDRVRTSQVPAFEADAPVQEDECLNAYDARLAELRKKLKPALNAIFQKKRPAPEELKALADWAAKAPALEQAHTDLARYNLAWGIRWLHHLAQVKTIRPGTREAYWTALLRGFRVMPGLAIHEVDEEALREALLGAEASSASLKLTRAAWKSFWAFLKEQKVPVPDIHWRRLRFPPDWHVACVLTPEELQRLLRHLQDTGRVSLARAVYLSARTGLRVSEVCRLCAQDLALKGRPYLVVRPSKRGKRRRVSLEHLSATELNKWREMQTKRLESGGNALFLVDDQGQPLVAEQVSAQTSQVLAELGLRVSVEGEKPLRYHDLRARAASDFYEAHRDVRFVTRQLGHALPSTTLVYARTIEPGTLAHLKTWRTPLNRPDLHIPLVVLTTLLQISDRRGAQLVAQFNATFPDTPIRLKTANGLPDGAERRRRGRQAHYLSVSQAKRLVRWCLAAKGQALQACPRGRSAA